MVTEVTAYAASDGRLFPTKWEAINHDAIIRLKTVFDKEEHRNLILNHREDIYDAIRPLIEFEQTTSTPKEQSSTCVES